MEKFILSLLCKYLAWAGPPTAFWGPRALTRNEALDHTCGGYCVKHNQHTSCYY